MDKKKKINGNDDLNIIKDNSKNKIISIINTKDFITNDLYDKFATITLENNDSINNKYFDRHIPMSWINNYFSF